MEASILAEELGFNGVSNILCVDVMFHITRTHTHTHTHIYNSCVYYSPLQSNEPYTIVLISQPLDQPYNETVSLYLIDRNRICH